MLLTKGFSNKIAAFTGSILVAFVGYAAISFTPTGYFLFIAATALVFTVPIPIANVSVRTILQTVVPLEMQGRVMSVVISLSSLATPLGMILSGVSATYVGTSNLFLACALTGMVVTVTSWYLTGIRHVEKMQERKESTIQRT